METRHIRIDYEEALSSKKQLLSAELNLLHIIKKMKNYKVLRKKEIQTKTSLKSELSALKSKINLIQSTFPQEEAPVKINNKTTSLETKKSQNLQTELEDIKSKLAKLG